MEAQRETVHPLLIGATEKEVYKKQLSFEREVKPISFLTKIFQNKR